MRTSFAVSLALLFSSTSRATEAGWLVLVIEVDLRVALPLALLVDHLFCERKMPQLIIQINLNSKIMLNISRGVLGFWGFGVLGFRV